MSGGKFPQRPVPGLRVPARPRVPEDDEPVDPDDVVGPTRAWRAARSIYRDVDGLDFGSAWPFNFKTAADCDEGVE